MKNIEKKTAIQFGEEGVTFARGYKANGVAAGLKVNGKRDVGLIYTERSATVAGTFTRNQFIAHPISHSREIVLKLGKARVILANSGNANACCGRAGDEVVVKTTEAIASKLGIAQNEVLTFSTGKIGGILPHEKISDAAPGLIQGLDEKNGEIFSEAILTTDTVMKCRSAEFKVGENTVRIGCSAKGAGMIEPGMATMLCFITSDVGMPKELLDQALKEAVDLSFNRITVDGDMSTNDSVVLFANGASGVEISSKKDPAYKLFKESLNHICEEIAKLIVADGEGATRVMKVITLNAKTEKDAIDVCRSIGNSMLFKCSIFGGTPDWGRILSSVGSTQALIDMANFSASLQGIVFFKNGEPDFEAKDKIRPLMQSKNIEIVIDLGMGKKSHYIWASDLTYKYVEINVV